MHERHLPPVARKLQNNWGTSTSSDDLKMLSVQLQITKKWSEDINPKVWYKSSQIYWLQILEDI